MALLNAAMLSLIKMAIIVVFAAVGFVLGKNFRKKKDAKKKIEES